MMLASLVAASLLMGSHPEDDLAIGDEARAIEQAMDELAIESLLVDVYGVISGPAGQPRDWDAMRAMFTADARLYAITPEGLRGGTLENYIDRSGPSLVDSGFTETGLTHRIEIYGSLGQAWSSYEGRFAMDGEAQTVRGINSFQLVRQEDKSWKVHSILWQQEMPGLPLPDDMQDEGGE